MDGPRLIHQRLATDISTAATASQIHSRPRRTESSDTRGSEGGGGEEEEEEEDASWQRTTEEG